MSLHNALQQLRVRLQNTQASHGFYIKLFFSLTILCIAASAIWIFGPQFTPLAPSNKRVYVILLLFLIWLLKFILVDLNAPHPLQYKNADLRKKALSLQTHFIRALHLLKTTNIRKHQAAHHLYDLPWYLLIGPVGAGKTSLIANANINFILQPRLNTHTKSNEHNQWWATARFSLLDVSGLCLSNQTLWLHLLGLIKQHRGNKAIEAIVIALPLPELLKQNDTRKYHTLCANLLKRIEAIQQILPNPIACQLVISKCDLLPGFNAFFAEATREETTQAWGVALTEKKEKMLEEFTEKFNPLIKKLNSQLLWRLHHERNPLVRPYIKDFPLQMERVKESILYFIKVFTETKSAISLQGIYLTSARQENNEHEDETITIEHHAATQAIQIFKEPEAASRPYFIKQFISQILLNTHSQTEVKIQVRPWKRRLSYIFASIIFVMTAALLWQDFNRSSSAIHQLQNHFMDYQLSIQHIQNPDERLEKALDLFNFLQPSQHLFLSLIDFHHPFTFYSDRTKQQTSTIYNNALQSLLLPEIRNYIGEYLKTPVNKSIDEVYLALRAYLMLGDASHFQAKVVERTLFTILPTSMTQLEREQLRQHVHSALQHFQSLALDTALVQQTRSYLTSLPSLQLSYTILRSSLDNSSDSHLQAKLSQQLQAIFTSQPFAPLPQMYTAQFFPFILTNETPKVVKEAVTGNWILGEVSNPNVNPDAANSLEDDLRTMYVNHYIARWENLLTSIQFPNATNLAQTDAIIIKLLNRNGPMVQILQTFHDNTYFEPIISYSQKLRRVGALVASPRISEQKLAPIFTQLHLLHNYLHGILTAYHPDKAAFNAVMERIAKHETEDPITQLRFAAAKYPSPINNWLMKVADNAWQYITQAASHYMDISWNRKLTDPSLPLKMKKEVT